MANKQSIAVDVDGVLAHLAKAFVVFSNTNYGTNLTVDDYHEHWGGIWGVDYDEMERRAAEFEVPETFAAFEANKDAHRALRSLSAHYDLYIVTARSEKLVEATQGWMQKYFPDIFKGIHFVPIWEPGNTITKADICKQIGTKYLIDDLVRHCNAAAEAGIEAILFGDYAYNRDEPIATGVIRCKDWGAVLSHFGVV